MSGGSGTASDRTTVGLRPGVSLEPDRQATVSPGQRVVYTHALTNSGNTTATFGLTLNSAPPGWSFNLQPAQVNNLAPNTCATVMLTATAPSGLADPAVAVITATWQGLAGIFDTAVDTTTIGCMPVFGADFALNPVAPLMGQAVTFTGTVDPASTSPITYTWNFGDDLAQVTGRVVTHTFTNAGSYNVVMTATNLCGVTPLGRPVLVNPYRIYLPLVLRNYPMSNLVVSAVYPSTNLADVSVVVQNLGNATVASEFWLVLYLDPTSQIQINQFWYNVGCSKGIVWDVRTPIQPGQALTVTGATASSSYTQWSPPFSAGTHSVYVQVDAWAPNGTTGLVPEINEGDNIYGPVTFIP
jgi:uncharacterized repeat protein (TIGR01451 family)